MTVAARLRAFEPVLRHVRPLYRWGRTRFMRWRHPDGGFVAGTGLPIFVDFRNDAYSWYDADAPNLAFDRRVMASIVAQSRGNVFIDIGAHYGFYSAVFAELAVGRRIKVIALEPDRENFRCLQRTLAHWRNADAVLLPVAAGDRDGSISLYRSEAAPCLHSFAEKASQPAYEVELLRLDRIVARHVGGDEKIAVIKIDVDGAEAFVLRGASETIAVHDPIVFIEFSPANLRGAGVEPREFFQDLCSRFLVYWVSYAANAVGRVSMSDYERIDREVGESITDFVLAQQELDFGSLQKK